MLETAVTQTHRKIFEKSEEEGEKLGKCVICGQRVKTSQNYLTTSEGYTHKNCIRSWKES